MQSILVSLSLSSPSLQKVAISWAEPTPFTVRHWQPAPQLARLQSGSGQSTRPSRSLSDPSAQYAPISWAAPFWHWHPAPQLTRLQSGSAQSMSPSQSSSPPPVQTSGGGGTAPLQLMQVALTASQVSVAGDALHSWLAQSGSAQSTSLSPSL